MLIDPEGDVRNQRSATGRNDPTLPNSADDPYRSPGFPACPSRNSTLRLNGGPSQPEPYPLKNREPTGLDSPPQPAFGTGFLTGPAGLLARRDSVTLPVDKTSVKTYWTRRYDGSLGLRASTHDRRGIPDGGAGSTTRGRPAITPYRSSLTDNAPCRIPPPQLDLRWSPDSHHDHEGVSPAWLTKR